MLEIKYKEVCNGCELHDAYLDNTTMYCSGDSVANVVVGCRHEKVCKAYIEAEK